MVRFKTLPLSWLCDLFYLLFSPVIVIGWLRHQLFFLGHSETLRFVSTLSSGRGFFCVGPAQWSDQV